MLNCWRHYFQKEDSDNKVKLADACEPQFAVPDPSNINFSKMLKNAVSDTDSSSPVLKLPLSHFTGFIY